MPKQILKIENFHGGLNNNSDPRDISPKELSGAKDIMVDEIGKVRTMGNMQNAYNELDNAGHVDPVTAGYGLFQFSHDRLGGEDAGSSESEAGDDYLAYYDDSDVQVWVFSRTTNDWDDDANNNEKGVINFNGNTTSNAAKPVFTCIDGNVRVCTGEFSKYASGSLIDDGSHFLTSEVSVDIDTGSDLSIGNYVQIDDEILYVTGVSSNTITFRRAMFGTKKVQHDNNTIVYILNMNQWYGYLNNNFFQDSGVSKYSTDKWYNEIQPLRSFDDLGVTMRLDDSSAASPAASDLVENRIIISYWLSKDGFWNGVYFVGLTPVYIGDQEGPLSVLSSTIQMHENILNLQVYVCNTPDVDSVNVTEHPFFDNRVIGFNIYTKAYTSDEWFLLKKIDLLEGGEHGWTQYDDTQTATGFWTNGTVSGQSSGVAAHLADPSPLDSYTEATAVTTVKPGTAMGSGRKGFLRVHGFNVSPLYTTVDLNSTSAQTHTFNVINPGPGAYVSFKLEVLDENFDILYTRVVTKDIADSGRTDPGGGSSTAGGYGDETSIG